MSEVSVLPAGTEPLRKLIADPEGLIFLRWLLLDICGILRSPMGLGDDLPYLCGKQDVGYQLLPALRAANPNILILLEPPDVPS